MHNTKLYYALIMFLQLMSITYSANAEVYTKALINNWLSWSNNNRVPGAATNNQATTATFAGGVTADDGLTYGLSYGTHFDVNQTISVLAGVTVQPEQVGKQVSIYVLASYNDTWFIKKPYSYDYDSGWQPWDLQLSSLTAHYNETRGRTEIKVAAQLSGLAGKFQVYVGYKVEGESVIYYNAQPFSFTVTSKGSNSTGALGKLNDTGIITCSDNSKNDLPCPQGSHPES